MVLPHSRMPYGPYRASSLLSCIDRYVYALSCAPPVSMYALSCAPPVGMYALSCAQLVGMRAPCSRYEGCIYLYSVQ